MASLTPVITKYIFLHKCTHECVTLFVFGSVLLPITEQYCFRMCGALLWCFLCSLAVTNLCMCLPCNSTFYLNSWHLPFFFVVLFKIFALVFGVLCLGRFIAISAFHICSFHSSTLSKNDLRIRLILNIVNITAYRNISVRVISLWRKPLH